MHRYRLVPGVGNKVRKLAERVESNAGIVTVHDLQYRGEDGKVGNARTLAQTVDATLENFRAALQCGQLARHGKVEIVVRMDGERDLADHALDDLRVVLVDRRYARRANVVDAQDIDARLG